MTTEIHTGVCYRPATLEDAGPIAEFSNRMLREAAGVDILNEEEIAASWRAGGFSLERDSRIAALDGHPVAAIELWDTRAPHVSKYVWLGVDPDIYGRGIEDELLRWCIDEARARFDRSPEGARITLRSMIYERDRLSREVLERAGFQPVRTFYDMQIELAEPPAAPRLSDGLQVRVMRPDEERAVYEAHHDAFRDHWGFVEGDPEQEFPRFWADRRQWQFYTPETLYVAVIDDEVVGYSLCEPHTVEDSEMGWVGILGVRRAWRGRGVGMALLTHSFHDLYGHGCRRVGLLVDGQNLTGATRLYERAGMHIHLRRTQLELELRPGTDLSTRTLTTNGDSIS